MPQTLPLEQYSGNGTAREDCTQWPSIQESSNRRKSITKSTTRNSWQLSTPLNNGGAIAKEQSIKCKYSPTSRTWSTSRRQKYSTSSKYDGRRSWWESTSKSTTGQKFKMGNQTCYQGVRSTARKRGCGKPANLDGFGKKSLRRNRPLRTNIYLLLGTTRLSPNKEMGREIQGKNKKERKRRRSLSTGMEGNGSHSPRRTVNKPKGQKHNGNPR